MLADISFPGNLGRTLVVISSLGNLESLPEKLERTLLVIILPGNPENVVNAQNNLLKKKKEGRVHWSAVWLESFV